MVGETTQKTFSLAAVKHLEFFVIDAVLFPNVFSAVEGRALLVHVELSSSIVVPESTLAHHGIVSARADPSTDAPRTLTLTATATFFVPVPEFFLTFAQIDLVMRICKT